jgi:hypothetical protein
MVHAIPVLWCLDTDAHPNIERPVELGSEAIEPFGALREHLEGVPRRPLHDVEHAPNVALRNLVVEEIAHGVHEHDLRFLPTERESQGPLVQGNLKAMLVVWLPHRL